MQQYARDEAGNIFEVDANGNPVRHVSAPGAPRQGQVFNLAPNPAQVQSGAREDERLRIAQAEEARRQAEYNATHNPDGSPKVNAPEPLGNANLRGPEYLATLPANIRNRVQQLLDGRSILTAREKGQPLGQQLMDAANQVDPNFDENASHARYTARQQFTGMGKGSLVVQAGERFAQHIHDLYRASTDLGGPDLGIAALSNTAGAINSQFNQKAVAKYTASLPFIAGELQKLTKNGAATEGESKLIMDNLAVNKPASVRAAAMQELVRLGRAQVEPLRDAWSSAWAGGNAPPMPNDFSPRTSAIFDTIEHGDKPLPLDNRGQLVLPPGYGPHGINGNNPNGEADGQVGVTTDPSGPQSHHYDPRFSAQVDSMINAGASLAKINDAAQKRGFPTVNAGDFAAAKAWMARPENKGKRYFGATMSKNEDLSFGQRALAAMGPGAAAAATGAANYANFAAAGIPKALTGPTGQGNLDAASALHPDAAVVGQVAGGVGGGLGAEYAVGKALTSRAPAVLAKVPWLASRAADAIYGGTLGFNESPDGGGLWGATKGAATAVAGGMFGAAAGKQVGKLSTLAKGSDAYLSPAQRSIYGATKGDFSAINPILDDATRLNMPVALGDTSPQLQALTGAVTRKSVDARSMAEQVLNPRAQGQAERAYDAINTHLAPVTNIAERGGQHITNARAASKPLYAAAEAHPAPVDASLTEMLNRPSGATAARKGYDIALNRGENPAELSFATAADGTPIINASPNYKTLHYVKRGLDSTVEGHRDIAGNLNLSDPFLSSVDGLRKDLVDRLGTLNPDYRAANAAYAQHAGLKTALDNGFNVSGSPMPNRDLVNVMGGMKQPQVPEFQRGYATGLSDQVGNKQLSGNPYDRIYGSTNQQAKIGTVFPQGAQDFGRINELEHMMGKTRNEALGGSPTAGRLQADAQLDGGMGTAGMDLASNLLTGGGINAGSIIKAGRRMFGDSAKLGVGKAAVKRADELAPLLLNTDPTNLTAYLNDLMARSAARNSRMRLGGQIGGGVGAGAASPFIVGR